MFLSLFYSQDSVANAEAALKDTGSKMVLEKGQKERSYRTHGALISREACPFPSYHFSCLIRHGAAHAAQSKL
jgi:hypothetical protein